MNRSSETTDGPPICIMAKLCYLKQLPFEQANDSKRGRDSEHVYFVDRCNWISVDSAFYLLRKYGEA